MSRRIGILTGGGDAPGLNAVIRAVVKRAVGQHHWQVVGIEDSFDGLLCEPHRILNLDLPACKGILHRGGTILGTTNHGDPFHYPVPGDGFADRSTELAEAVRDEGLEGLIVIGGDGTQKIGWRLMQEHGVPVVGVPKTIDNDLSATDYTFGFMSAVDVATDALDRLHSTAESHERVMLLEVMGRDAGWISLYAGIAGGADCIVIPEIPYDPDRIARKIHKRRNLGRPFTLIVVAEGAVPHPASGAGESQAHPKVGGGRAAYALAELLSQRSDAEIRVTVLGHLQRGGGPVPFDRILATRFGVGVVDLVSQERWGQMVCLRDGKVDGVPIEAAISTYRLVDPEGELVRTAKAVGIEFGA
jgi:phosphofructokinase-like protein